VRDSAPHEKRGALARLVFDNLPLKILSLVLSIALFSLVHSDQDAQRSLYVDVVALLPPPHSDKMLVTDIPTQVKVTMRGSRTRISALQRDDFSPMQMDLRDTSRRYFYFDPSAVSVSGAAQVVSVEPRAVELVWVPRSEKRVPVRARLRGTPEDGSMVKRPVEIVPAIVAIYGPDDEVKTISEVYTEDIPIDGITAGTHERRVQLEPLPGHVEYLDQVAADVRIAIVPEVAERMLRRLEVAVMGQGDAAARPAVVAVQVRGPARLLQDLEPDQVVPFVDLEERHEGPGTISLDVHVRGLPEGFEVARVIPPTVLITRTK
jgi:YbbR domain-containing protein